MLAAVVGCPARRWAVFAHLNSRGPTPWNSLGYGFLGKYEGITFQGMLTEGLWVPQGMAATFLQYLVKYNAVVVCNRQFLFHLKFMEQFDFYFLKGGWSFSHFDHLLSYVCLLFCLLADCMFVSYKLEHFPVEVLRDCPQEDLNDLKY